MNTALAALAALSIYTSVPFHATGRAYHYYYGLMQRVAWVRVRQGLIPYVRHDVDGYASTRWCGNIGKTLYARFADSRQVEDFQIVDCSNPADLPHQEAEGLVAEFDYQTAERHPALLYYGHIGVQLLAIVAGN